MPDLIFSVPSCFSSSSADHPAMERPSPPPAQAAASSAYRVEIAGHRRVVTVTWCKNQLAHGLSVSIEGADDAGKDITGWSSVADGDGGGVGGCKQKSSKVEPTKQPWHFWRKYGAKRFRVVDGGSAAAAIVDVFWDLREAKFAAADDDDGEEHPQPAAGYYTAVVFDGEIVLLVGDLRRDALRRTGARPAALPEPVLVCRREHRFGARRFAVRAALRGDGDEHDIAVITGDGEMAIEIDGETVHVRHLRWKFRGTEVVRAGGEAGRVRVYWDVHDWLFGAGLRHAVFLFRPEVESAVVVASPSPAEVTDGNVDAASDFSLFLYAWKIE